MGRRGHVREYRTVLLRDGQADTQSRPPPASRRATQAGRHSPKGEHAEAKPLASYFRSRKQSRQECRRLRAAATNEPVTVTYELGAWTRSSTISVCCPVRKGQGIAEPLCSFVSLVFVQVTCCSCKSREEGGGGGKTHRERRLPKAERVSVRQSSTGTARHCSSAAASRRGL